MLQQRTLLILESVLIMSLSIVWLTLIAISATRAYQVKVIKSSNIRLPTTPIIGDSSTSQPTDRLRAELDIFLKKPDAFERQYVHFPDDLRVQSKKEVRQMFEFAYDSYMQHAYPYDELDPIHCTGRGPDFDNPSNININDVLGNYSLTLIDTLDTLAVFGNATEFKRAVQLVIDNVSFDSDHNVQVFEANIRILGALISAHLLIEDETRPFGDLRPPNYRGQLLDLARDLATRLLPAFDNSPTGIPYPRVNLRHGLPTTHLCDYCATQTCTAGAGSLLLEFGLLSKLINDPVFESVARRAAKNLWNRRDESTGLLGNVIDVETGEWVNKMSGIGAGLDSFYEYLLKSYVLFGELQDYQMFNQSYTQIKRHLRRGRAKCNEGAGNHPVYVNVNMIDGSTTTLWIDSLQAAFAGVQVLSGDVEEAICHHALYFAIWKRYGALPERFNWQRLSPDVSFYPLRPELIESTYLLYQATKNPFYLHVGREILDSLNKYTKVKCGYATIHNVEDMSLEDRMESFFLSETCKYLYLLFDEDNPLNKNPTKYVFTTEGHIFPVKSAYRKRFWENAHLLLDFPQSPDHENLEQNVIEANKLIDKILANEQKLTSDFLNQIANQLYKSNNDTQNRCDRIDAARTFDLPLKSIYFSQLTKALNSN